MSATYRSRSPPDPLDAALLPPSNESTADRGERLRAEEQAKKVSDDIDEMLNAERNERRKKAIKVLLLGQSEGGKSTVLKQFQLLHAPTAFHAERIAWRFVIYLNLARSIRRTLDAISPDHETLNSHTFDDDDDKNAEAASVIIPSTDGTPSCYHKINRYEGYYSRLAPLLFLEQRLIALLSDKEDDEEWEATRLTNTWSHSPSLLSGSVHGSKTPPDSNGRLAVTIPQTVIHPSLNSLPSPQPTPELSVKTTSNWKKALSSGGRMKNPKSPHSGKLEGWWEDPDDPVHILNECAPAMLDLWEDPNVKQRLTEKRLRLEESSGFYLDEIPRITAKKYIPTDVDVLKARLKTTGVFEHTLTIKTTTELRGLTWKIYDVGGSRKQRHAWAPFFDDVNAIIFLAPISTFDQVLAEDPHVNRLQDSLLLWKSIVSNKLLSDVNIILFLNKCDLLQAKLDAGVRLNRYMASYGDRPNDYDSISNYFRNKFCSLHQSYTPNRGRELYIHLTSVTDTRRTRAIISSTRDFILRSNLKIGDFM